MGQLLIGLMIGQSVLYVLQRIFTKNDLFRALVVRLFMAFWSWIELEIYLMDRGFGDFLSFQLFPFIACLLAPWLIHVLWSYQPIFCIILHFLRNQLRISQKYAALKMESQIHSNKGDPIMKQYHVCKKLLVLCLLFSMSLIVFAGCSSAEKEMAKAGEISGLESQTHIQVGTSEDESASGNTPKEPLTGDFVVSEKKYNYNDANLELLYVENQTNRHFNVTINGTYLDANGEPIKEESQTFEGFPAGWKNYFVFYPSVAFDSFTYTVETEEFTGGTLASDEDGNPLADYIELEYEQEMFWERALGLNGPDGVKEMRALAFWVNLINNHPSVCISFTCHLLLLDEQGEIYMTDFEFDNPTWGTAADPIGGEDDGRQAVRLRKQDVGLDESIPENIQGKFTVIFAVTEAIDYTKFFDQMSSAVSW